MKSTTKLTLVFIIVGLFTLFLFAYYKEGTLPVSRADTTSKIFQIKQGENFNTIVKNLENAGLIRNKIIFFLVVKRLKLERTIQAGNFQLSPAMDAYEVAQALTHGTTDNWITIIEGLRKEEVAEIIAKKFDIEEIEFIKLAPEGYLYPDTYSIPQQSTSDGIIKIFKDNFNAKYTAALQAKARHLVLSDEQVVILASLVEREARTDADRKTVAGILLKRLKNDWPLNIDATIQYALGYQPQEKRWWKKELSEDDLKIDSPYNTYKSKGLPPTPICSPGISSISAVVEADPTTPYWFYVSEPGTGILHFAKTLEEQEANITKYLR